MPIRNKIIGKHPSIKKILNEISLVAPTECTVLIQGETGTGKELFARAIHNESLRKNRTMIKLNCGAIPTNLIESELFGHEKGAFTGAQNTRIGRFEQAHKSTLFLDEVAELSRETQTKLLRVIQEQEFERVGGNKTIRVSVRIIAATHKDLRQQCELGAFRYDLFYRLNVFPLYIPPLRNRKSDISLLINFILTKLSKKLHKTLHGLTSSSLGYATEYHWHGNIRELENVLERAAILSDSPIIKLNKTEFCVHANLEQQLSNEEFSLQYSLNEVEKKHICKVLRGVNWKISGPGGAAEILKLHPNTLRSRMSKLGIKSQSDAKLTRL